MLPSSYNQHFCYTGTDIIYIEHALLKTQAKIYQAAQVSADRAIRKEYDIAVCRKNIIFFIAKNAIKLIKKKFN